ncbi:MAG: asparagine synthase (glutamine-hydrolyzing) [Isosphaeraceae bacterium]|nr:asparagine synthase (glutamine-hydrolyzing) [Isosphaeraceae bacterium]
MCGIAGALDLTGQREFPAARLLNMTGAIARRGPDDERIHIEPGIALGVRRLSVVDLEGGRQPIANEDGSLWVAYNGELYDYPVLREELLARGHRLASRCDTEAWVHMYEDRGEGMFERARGDYGVALWDRPNRTLILGRDRVGVCPLYYAERDGWLLWGSEVKVLLASGLVAARPDLKGIDHFFSFFCAGTERTYFEGVKSIPPGHYLKIKDGRVELKKYWDLDFPDAGQERRLADPTPLVEELEALLTGAVERRLHCDVPVVSYISGGLDSTTVLGLSKKIQGEAVPSFAVSLDGAGTDEGSKAAEAARVLGSHLTTLRMDRHAIASAYPELMTAAEAPVLDTTAACMLCLAGEVHSQGYKVVLTGEGSDEALAGYIWFKIQKVRMAFRRGPTGALLKLARKALVRGGKGGHRPALRALGGVRPAQQDVYDILGQSRSLLYSPALWDSLGDHDPYSDVQFPSERLKRWHPLNQSLYVAYKLMLAGMLLSSKGDRVARWSSVEARYPFLDETVIEFCAGIAPEYKLRGLTDKWILRQVARRTLPQQIASRRKTMFRANLSAVFLDDHRPAWVDQLLSPESLRASGYFDSRAIADARLALPRLPRISARRLALDAGLASAVTTQLWHHIYCGGGLCDLPVWSPPERQALRPQPVVDAGQPCLS